MARLEVSLTDEQSDKFKKLSAEQGTSAATRLRELVFLFINNPDELQAAILTARDNRKAKMVEMMKAVEAAERE